MPSFFIKVFVPGPFFEPLVYVSKTPIDAGIRVRVVLGSREIIGISDGETAEPKTLKTIKSILSIIDECSIISEEQRAIVQFASDYYNSPLGDLLLHSLPAPIRKGRPMPAAKTEPGLARPCAHQITDEQLKAIQSIDESYQSFQCFLLQGVTGSGKTQIFSELIHRVLARQQQVLLLVPEIGLTGQMVERIREQLDGQLAVSHSGLADGARARAFVAASNGIADILIGTRSTLFTPMPRLGLILIDEEHDGAYKNQEGCRYSARDLAVVRAQQRGIPVVLSSATPSLESWHRAELGKYKRLRLSSRPSQRPTPLIRLVDARQDKPRDGLSDASRRAIRQTIDRERQVLVFLNRRGYSPVLMCTDCGWMPNCRHCDARPTLHKQPDCLWCHHCDHRSKKPNVCPECVSSNLLAIGQGTKRLEEALSTSFSDIPIIRVDRDTTTRRRAFQKLLEPVINGDPCIMVGTQMLAKGHDFKKLSTVIIADADQGLSSADFRSVEHFVQLLTQVAGRAGRYQDRGQVLIQTHQPDSVWINRILEQDYDRIATVMIAERKQFNWPPSSHLALITGRATTLSPVFNALEEIAQNIKALNSPVKILGPAPAPMERRNRQYHGQLLLLGKRSVVQWVLKVTGPWAYKKYGKVSIQLDVDPRNLS
ncbi:MAG: primosomal protein N' [Gammaproteobacteria bacterium]|nr:primosomal protein N' [Gammaproteobacteria bacterium]HAN80951.1 primosomal protein N' [Gammaproteobacteria bacterium]